MKRDLFIIGLFSLLIVTCFADNNNLSFEINFDASNTKQIDGKNYYGLDYIVTNKGKNNLGISNLSKSPLFELYLINPQKNTSKMIFSFYDNFLKSISYRSLRMLQPGEKKMETIWFPTTALDQANRESKLVASKLFYYNINRDLIECMLSFRVYSEAIPVGDIRPISINPSTNK